MSATLVHIPYSPWSRRVRLALRRLEVPVEEVVHAPVLSEPWLRWRLRRPRGRFTLPVLLRPEAQPIEHGLDIVRWAEQRSTHSLIGDDDAVAHWSGRADALMNAGRLRTTTRVLADDEALRASLPPPVDRLGPVGLWIGRDAAHRLARKYPDDADDTARLRVMEAVLEETREALSGGEYILKWRSYADYCLACALEFVEPHAKSRLAPAARRCWREPALAERFADVLAWRDRVIAE